MRTLKLIGMTMIACLFTYTATQAQVFVIERGASTTLTFDNIKAAVNALQDNDRLYLPPGGHPILPEYTWEGYNGLQNHSRILMINKKVSIFGAGYNDGANSTVITRVGGSGTTTFAIGKDANGSFITGVEFANVDFQLDNVSNCIVSRIRISGNGGFRLAGIGNNNMIIESDFRGVYPTTCFMGNISPTISSTFSKCIFRTNAGFSNSNLHNNLFLNNQFSGTSFNNCSLSNNIIITSTTAINSQINIPGNNNTFSNNLWVGGFPSSSVSQNNTFLNEIERESFANTFVNHDNDDFRLKPGSRGKNAGTDGTDVGIFGTVVPFKENRLPAIPHFKAKIISPETSADGKLPVFIQIEAQDR